jgi:hypothetical protein
VITNPASEFSSRAFMNGYSGVIKPIRRFFIVWVLVAVAGCGNSSYVGEQAAQPPKAIATTVGDEFVADANGNMSMLVRAGADVTLTGKESNKNVEDTGLPIITFDWKQDSTDAVQVQLIKRSNNTVSFVAPQVTADSLLHFTLAVSDAKGLSDSANVTVTVKGVRDPDRFLQFLTTVDAVPMVMTTQTPIAASPTAQLGDRMAVVINVSKLLTFTDRSKNLQTRVLVGDPVKVTASWSKKLGSSTSCTANESPTAKVPVMRMNLDDKLKAPIPGFPDAVVLSDVLESSDATDSTVKLEMRFDIDTVATNSAIMAAAPGFCINGEATASSSGETRDTEALLDVTLNGNVRDSKLAAQAYYAAINPSSEVQKDTFDTWLRENGFNPTALDLNADAHTIYTNNFDLGFGRDMYMKFGGKGGKCDDGSQPLPVTASHLFSGTYAGQCDVAAVVMNYGSIEAAAKKLNPVVAVAMEYSRTANAGERYVKFYTFAPDRTTGVFKRVLSVNLDRRGEQFLPQACVICHGGTPKALVANAYPNNGDVSAAFLPWDLDSFLYSDTDAGFSARPRDAALRASYTKAKQEAQFKLLNLGAYMTMSRPDPTGRHALLRELIEHWYGGGSGVNGLLTTSTYDDTSLASVPAGWLPGNNGNPADSAALYQNVFARNCRMCHTAHVSANGDPRTALVNDPTNINNPKVPACNKLPTSSAVPNPTASVGLPNQVPMGCYWEFAQAPNLAENLSRNQMPLTRRAADRLWGVANGSSTAPIAQLQAHLLKTQGVTVDVPGTIKACIDSNLGTPIQSQSGTKYQVTRGSWVNLSANCSRFVSSPQWALMPPTGSVASLVGPDTAQPRFLADLQGDYVLALTDMTGASTSVIANVATVAPVAGSGAVTISLGVGGNGTSPAIDVTALSGFSSRDTVTAISNVVASPALTVTVLSATTLSISTNSLVGGTVSYQLIDADGDVSTNVGTITVSASAGLSIGSSPTLTVPANSTNVSIALASFVNNPANQPLVFTILSTPTLSRTLTLDNNFADATNRQTQSLAVGSIVLNNATSGATSYNAPKGVLSQFAGRTMGAQDSFTYRACFAAQPATCTGTGTVTISLTSPTGQSFSGLTQSLISASCNGCHGAPPVGSRLQIPNTVPASGSVESKAFYCVVRGLSLDGGGSESTSGNEPLNTPYVHLSAPIESLLYRKPQATQGCSAPAWMQIGGGPALCHGAGTQWLDPLDANDAVVLNAIQQWFIEGAYFTEGTTVADQSCP